MGRSLNKLNAKRVAAAKAGRHSDGGGLYLVVAPSGAAKWIFRYSFGGKSTDLGLGSARDVALASARERAGDFRALLARGSNPKAEHQKEAIPTFGEAADRYIAAHRTGWRSAKHAAQWEMTLREYAASLRPKHVNEIDTDDILGVLQPIWTEKPETARRLRGRVESVLDAAKVKGHRTGDNPARLRGHLDKLLPRTPRLSRGHHAAMPFDQVPMFVSRLRQRIAMAALAMEFLILTAARTGEVIGAFPKEIDQAKKLWTVPKERMKAGREHRVPLCARAVAVAQAAAKLGNDPDGYLFPGPRKGAPLSNMAMNALLRRMGIEVTTHGFRSAFRDWCGERTAFPRDVAEAALAHTISDKVEAAYRRGDALEKRRKLMDAWAQFLDAPKKGNVVPLNRAG